MWLCVIFGWVDCISFEMWCDQLIKDANAMTAKCDSVFFIWNANAYKKSKCAFQVYLMLSLHGNYGIKLGKGVCLWTQASFFWEKRGRRRKKKKKEKRKNKKKAKLKKKKTCNES